MPALIFLADSHSFISLSSVATSLSFFLAARLLSWAWIALRILDTSFILERGVTENIFL